MNRLEITLKSKWISRDFKKLQKVKVSRNIYVTRKWVLRMNCSDNLKKNELSRRMSVKKMYVKSK